MKIKQKDSKSGLCHTTKLPKMKKRRKLYMTSGPRAGKETIQFNVFMQMFNFLFFLIQLKRDDTDMIILVDMV